MSAGQPYLGSKISLISKSEIRYEGILYTIDTTESTVALAKVRSFGTEDRPSERPAAAREEVYEYVIFRGSDIKDIRVCEPPKPTSIHSGLPNDPAIVQHSVAVTPAANYGQPSTFKQSFGPLPGLPYSSYPPPMMGQVPNIQTLPTMPQTSIITSGMSEPGARAETPVKRKSPTMDQGTQVSGSNIGDDKRGSGRTSSTSRSSVGSASGRQGRGSNRSGNQGGSRQGALTPPRGTGRKYTGGRGGRGGSGFVANNQSTANRQSRGGQLGGGGGGGGGGGRGTGRPSSAGANRQKNTKLDFQGEYDFEQANAEFKELENKLAKTKLDDKRDDSGNETTVGENDQEEEQQQQQQPLVAVESSVSQPATADGGEVCYDKNKSFFDSISCEALERNKGGFKRTDWRQERKLNVETFGVATNYYRRGGYRGRGGFRGRGGGGGYRGGRGRGRGGGGGGGGGGGQGGQVFNRPSFFSRARGGRRSSQGAGENVKQSPAANSAEVNTAA